MAWGPGGLDPSSPGRPWGMPAYTKIVQTRRDRAGDLMGKKIVRSTTNGQTVTSCAHISDVCVRAVLHLYWTQVASEDGSAKDRTGLAVRGAAPSFFMGASNEWGVSALGSGRLICFARGWGLGLERKSC